ncbi:MAG TPA: galactokinase [Nocardioidaceae bacterium]|nr:galactokinase [Nocardioidaceae bacterium]
MTIEQIPAGSPADIAGRLAHRFRATHGREPVGCFAAPGRVNLIGEHVDYNDGKCLPMALPHATYAVLAPRDDSTVTVTSLQQDEPWQGDVAALGPGEVEGWAAYVVGVAWALREKGFELPGLDILVDSRVPVGGGLSSSAALECSVALGLCAVAGVDVDEEVRHQLVTACMRAETEVAGAPTGGMDQTVSLFATAEHALLIDCRDWTTDQVPWDPSTAGLELLVVDTRASHSLTDGGYESRRADCDTAAAALGVATLREVADPASALDSLEDEQVRRRARHVFTEMARVDEAVGQLRERDFQGLGRTFDASHDSLRDDFEVSAPELDMVVDTARAHGSLGARMTGGGFGGSAIALVPEDSVDKVCRAVVAAFADHGWQAPGFLRAVPAGGARRVELP